MTELIIVRNRLSGLLKKPLNNRKFLSGNVAFTVFGEVKGPVAFATHWVVNGTRSTPKLQKIFKNKKWFMFTLSAQIPSSQHR